MAEYIMVACDLHDETMLLKVAQGRGAAEKRVVENSVSGRRQMILDLKRRAKACPGAKVVFAYEASSQGFGLCDELTEAGIVCHVLAPTKIARSAQHRRRKTDERDADRILDILRGHLLGGNELPSVWVPDAQTLEDREILRGRLDVGEKLTVLKTQVRTLLKRNSIPKPAGLSKNWTGAFESWLRGLAGARSPLTHGAKAALRSLLRQRAALEEERAQFDQEIAALAQTSRYAHPARAMTPLHGVGLFTAMVFLTEMGDLGRFANRKQVGAYLGLAPSSDESGKDTDHKGHITHQGPWRVRRVLCQATWSRVRTDPHEKAVYERLVRKNPKHKKIAVVAAMRRLAVVLWHLGSETQRRHGCFTRERPSQVA
jgi:transposase